MDLLRNFLGAGLLTLCALGRADEPLTLSAAIAEARAHNPELLTLQARIRTVQSGVDVAKATSFNPEFSFEDGFDYRFGLRFTVEWPGKRRLREAIARHDVTAAEAALEGFKVALAAEVRTRFYELLTGRQQAEMAEREVKASEALLETARQRVEGGFASATERTRAQVDVLRAQRQLRGAQRNLVTSQTALNLLLGREPQAPLQIQGDLTATLPVVDLGKLTAVALAHHPDLQTRQLTIQRRTLAVKLATQERRPDFSIGPTYEQNAKNSAENKVGVALTIPLPLGGPGAAKVAEARAEKQEAETELEKAMREVKTGVQKAYLAYVAAQEELALFSPELQTELEMQLEATQKKYANGELPFLMVVEARRTYYDYRKDRYDSLAAARAAQADLEKAAAITLEESK